MKQQLQTVRDALECNYNFYKEALDWAGENLDRNLTFRSADIFRLEIGNREALTALDEFIEGMESEEMVETVEEDDNA